MSILGERIQRLRDFLNGVGQPQPDPNLVVVVPDEWTGIRLRYPVALEPEGAPSVDRS